VSEQPPARRLTVDEIREMVRQAAADGGPPGEDVSPARRALRERTALLGAFDAGSLAAGPAGGDEAERALREFLAGDCERVSTREGRRWRLLPAVRTAALEALRTPEHLVAALGSGAADVPDRARDWAVRLLKGAVPALEKLAFEDLYAVLTVVSWFEDAPLARAAVADNKVVWPSPGAVRRRIELARLLMPLETLAGSSFTGREHELALLAAHAGVPVPGGARAVRGDAVPAASRERRPWLMIHGPGGVGKSTLVARFVLDHADRTGAADGRRLPFAYLSFERTDLQPERPLTLLGEAARQLGLLVPAFARPARALERAVRGTLAADSTAETERGSRRTRRFGHDRDEHVLIQVFARLIADATGDDGLPVVLVLDTFEQVQRKGPLALEQVLAFLGALQAQCPGLRIVVAGRAPVDDPPFAGLPLTGFDPATARAFLRGQLPGEGEEYEAALGSITRAVRSDPLSLKLAAALIRRKGPGALEDPELLRQVRLRLRTEEVQGVLYRRILDDLDDPDLRRIASPGLTVRKVTPEVIREVLAGPCGLGPVDGARARDLFRRLRAEAALVETVPGEEAVTHRADVRRTMLPLLRHDAGPVMDRIHRRAVRYYTRLSEARTPPDPALRAEELYHRLSLGQGPATVDRRWTGEAGALLDAALDELPPRGRVYLSERLGNTVTSELRAEADDETWGRQALRAGTGLLAAGNPGQVLPLLDERPGHVDRNAALATLRIRALAALGRDADARDLVEPALDLASTAWDSNAFTEIALIGARIDEDRGRFAAAGQLLSAARQSAEASGSGVTVLSVAVAQLRLHRRCGTLDTDEARTLRDDLLERVPHLRRRDYARHPELVRELAAEIGDARPSLVSDTARLLGVDFDGGAGHVLRTSLTEGDLRNFTEVTGRLLTSTATAAGSVAASVSGDGADGPAAGADGRDSEHDTSLWLAGNTSVSRGAVVGAFLDSAPDRHDAWTEALVTTYQHEVDRTPFTTSGSGTGADTPAATCDAVVFVPGFMGSALVDAASGDRVWGDWRVTDWLRLLRGGVPSALRLTDDERAGHTGRLRASGLLELPSWTPLFGATDPYRRLLDAVRSAVLDPDAVLAFPYDWRLPVSASGPLLAEAALRHLERWREHDEVRRARRAGLTGGREPRLVFVTHSTGGLVARSALAAVPELAPHTRELVSIGTPFHGSPRVVELLAADRPPLLPRTLRELARHLPVLYDLLPDYRCVEADGELRHLTLRDVDAVGGDTDLARAALDAREQVRRAPSLPPVRAVVGIGQPTTQSLAFTDGRVRSLAGTLRVHRDGTPVLDGSGTPLRWDRGGDGVVPRDAAVPVPSSAVCYVPGRHGTLASDPVTLRWVRAVLTELPEPLGPQEPGPDPAAATAPPQGPGEGAGIGLPTLRQGLGLSLPEVAVPGEPWTLSVRGAATRERVRCRVSDESDGRLVARPELRGDGDVLTARVTLPAAGLYRVSVGDGDGQISEVVPALDPDDNPPDTR
jgi:AAA ATPase-like protein/lecithin:cholesterol acyltransferase